MSEKKIIWKTKEKMYCGKCTEGGGDGARDDLGNGLIKSTIKFLEKNWQLTHTP